MADPGEERIDLFEDLRHRSSEIYGRIRWWAIGPTRFVFWGGLTLVLILGMVRLASTIKPRQAVPEKSKIRHQGPELRVMAGRIYALGAHGKRQRVAHLIVGRSYQVRSEYNVVVFGDDSTFRPTKHCTFEFRQAKDGHFLFTLDRAGGWFQLSPTDEAYVQFPNCHAWLKVGGTACEFHIRKGTRTRVHDRKGDVSLYVSRKLIKPVTKDVLNPTTGLTYRQTFRYSINKPVKLKDGDLLVVGVRKNVVPKPIPDNRWERWNLKWTTPSQLRAMPRANKKKLRDALRHASARPKRKPN